MEFQLEGHLVHLVHLGHLDQEYHQDFLEVAAEVVEFQMEDRLVHQGHRVLKDHLGHLDQEYHLGQSDHLGLLGLLYHQDFLGAVTGGMEFQMEVHLVLLVHQGHLGHLDLKDRQEFLLVA